jgi:hypothetical protein
MYVCFNRPLADHIERLVPGAGGRVATAHMLRNAFLGTQGITPDYASPDVWDEMETALSSADLPETWKCDVLIVDEGRNSPSFWLPKGISCITVKHLEHFIAESQMIVKNADDKGTALAALELLLTCAEGKQQKLIEDELRMMRAGIKGEQESAYHIDFDFRDSETTAVIHDLRLESAGRVAQIDHLIIHRTHKFYVLETKSFSHGLKVTDEGEFLRWNDWKKTYEGMPSPIEQNRRHVEVLRDVLERWGYAKPQIESFVLISPTARIDRSKAHPCPEVVKADQFTTAFTKRFTDSLNSLGGIIGGLSKIVFGDSPDVIAKKLVTLHKPITVDYEAKFSMGNVPVDAGTRPTPDVVAPEPLPKTAAQAEAAAVTGDAGIAPACKSCGSNELSVEYGKYGYYFKCKPCGANTALKIGCAIPGHKEKIRKSQLTFYRECEQCGSSAFFYVNKPD